MPLVKRYALPIYFGRADGSVVSNGTVTLIRLDGKPIAVTCNHVIKAHEDQQARFGDSILQIGDLHIEPQMMLHREDRPDLATIDLTGKESLIGPPKRVRFWEPVQWPPPPALEEDVLFYCGYPGDARQQPGAHQLSFAATFILGDVLSSTEEGGSTSIGIQQCDVTGPLAPKTQPSSFNPGGFSGCPMFMIHHDSVIYPELVAIGFEYNSSFDLFKFHHLKLIGPDGSIHQLP